MTVTLLCLASYYKGTKFLKAAHAAGAQVLLLTREKFRDAAWPMDSLSDCFFMPTLRQQSDVINAVSYLCRERQIDQIIALDDYDVPTVAALREHLRLPGMGETVTRYFRDKLAMRLQAQKHGIRVPEFTAVNNYPRLSTWMDHTPAPWLLKPRQEAGAMGIKKMFQPEEVWQKLRELGDEQSHFLLERFVPGAVYHIDSIVQDGKVIFESANQYGRPPIDVAHKGGVFISRTLERESAESAELSDLNQQIVTAFGMAHGVTHTEFLKADSDGQFYFIETAARVGGANLDTLIEAATNINLWEEWAKLEIAKVKGETYQLPETRAEYAGILVCLAKQAYPDLSQFNDSEVIWRMHKKYHAGVVVRSTESVRVRELLDDYSRRFAHDFLAVAPPLDRAPE